MGYLEGSGHGLSFSCLPFMIANSSNTEHCRESRTFFAIWPRAKASQGERAPVSPRATLALTAHARGRSRTRPRDRPLLSPAVWSAHTLAAILGTPLGTGAV